MIMYITYLYTNQAYLGKLEQVYHHLDTKTENAQ